MSCYNFVSSDSYNHAAERIQQADCGESDSAAAFPAFQENGYTRHRVQPAPGNGSVVYFSDIDDSEDLNVRRMALPATSKKSSLNRTSVSCPPLQFTRPSTSTDPSNFDVNVHVNIEPENTATPQSQVAEKAVPLTPTSPMKRSEREKIKLKYLQGNCMP